jgi:hypothetical protein
MTQNKGLVLVHSAIVTFGLGLFSLQAQAQSVAGEQQPLCFMETTTRQLVDLSRLCIQRRPASSAVTHQTLRRSKMRYSNSSITTIQFEQNLQSGEEASGQGSV